MIIGGFSMNDERQEQALSHLAGLERTIDSGRATMVEVQEYCKLATTLGRLGDARSTLDGLRKKYPGSEGAAKLYISLCLQLGDNGAAMAAIETMASRVKPTDDFLAAALSVRQRLGPKTVRDDDIHSLSLCIIVRNESAFVGPCLDGIKALVDEIILVDTGSKDRTADIGRIFGARVHDFKWCDDFSAARNFSLSKAAGRWVLILDADETIAASDFDHIRGLIRQNGDSAAAYSLETRNYCHTANVVGVQAHDGCYPAHEAGLGWFPSTKVRLFKREDSIRFHFPVHERVEPSLRAAGIPVMACKVPVHHYGHLNEVCNQRKAQRYYELGIAKLAEMGDDPAAIRELAVQAGKLEHWEESLMLWQRFLAVRPDYPEAFINMASANWQLGRYEESLAWSRKAVAADGTMKEAHLNAALSHLLMGDFISAQTILENVVTTHGDYLSARFMLGVAYAAAGFADKCRAMLSGLQGTAAGEALPQAAADIRQRLQRAGLGHAAQLFDAVAGPLLPPLISLPGPMSGFPDIGIG